jgi:hypothetical protein
MHENLLLKFMKMICLLGESNGFKKIDDAVVLPICRMAGDVSNALSRNQF